MSVRRWSFALQLVLIPMYCNYWTIILKRRNLTHLFSASYSRSDILRQLRELNDLRVMGVLSEEEFADKKKVIFDDLN